MTAAEKCPWTGHADTLDRSVRTTPGTRRGDVFRLTRVPVLNLLRRPDRRLPGPTGLPVIGVTPRLFRDPFTFLRDAATRHGDIFRVPVPGYDLVIVAHPDLVREVFHNRGDKFGLPPYPNFLKKAVGQGFAFLDGDEYTKRRSLVTPMFGKRFLAGLADPFVAEMTAQLRKWEKYADSGDVIDLEHEFAKILMPAFMVNMFSVRLTDAQIHRYDEDLRYIMASGASLIWCRKPPNFLPIPGRNSIPAAFKRMIAVINQMLDERENDPVEHHDLLQVLVDARLPDGSRVERGDLVFDTGSIMIAGYDTVVAALSWMFALLPTNPAAQQRLYDEIDTLGSAAPTAAHLPTLQWTKQCFDEAQRLQGHPFNPRLSKIDNELAGYHIPKGTVIGACMTALNRDPRWWTNPNIFDPTHFDRDQVQARPKTAFIPFGTGPHQCIGMALAYQNAQLLTALITQRYRIHLQPGWTPIHQNTMAITIKGGVPCTITRRTDGSGGVS
jgi:cytochrome P450